MSGMSKIQASFAMPMVSVNGAELHHEVRGSGPPVLLIMGATGDGGHFDTLADLLADEFTVITYDRRGNGRSPAPAGWTTTSAEEQADDAAALVDSLAVGPLAVFGTSSGGNFALWMLTRHLAMVHGAVLHEPGVYAVLDDFDVVRAPLQGGARTRTGRAAARSNARARRKLLHAPRSSYPPQPPPSRRRGLCRIWLGHWTCEGVAPVAPGPPPLSATPADVPAQQAARCCGGLSGPALPR